MKQSGNLHSRRAAGHRAALLGAGLVAGLSLSSHSAAVGDCEAPPTPKMPDGATASLEAMLEGQKAVKEFQTDNMEYMQCLEQRYTDAEAAAEAAEDAAARSAAAADYSESIEAYNAAVSEEENVAGAFNVELRAYKAANR